VCVCLCLCVCVSLSLSVCVSLSVSLCQGTFHAALRGIDERHSRFELRECRTFWCEAEPYMADRGALLNVTVDLSSPRSSMLLKYKPVT
jgi:hypothetical protein